MSLLFAHLEHQIRRTAVSVGRVIVEKVTGFSDPTGRQLPADEPCDWQRDLNSVPAEAAENHRGYYEVTPTCEAEAGTEVGGISHGCYRDPGHDGEHGCLCGHTWGIPAESAVTYSIAECFRLLNESYDECGYCGRIRRAHGPFGDLFSGACGMFIEPGEPQTDPAAGDPPAPAVWSEGRDAADRPTRISGLSPLGGKTSAEIPKLCTFCDLPPHTDGDHLFEETTEDDPAASTSQPAAGSPECECWPVEKPWTYYGIVEPGGAMEFNPDCPKHGKPAWFTTTVPAGLRSEGTSPAGLSTPGEFAAVAVREVLADHQPIDEFRPGRLACFHDDSSICTWLSDLEEWREHVAGEVARRIDAATNSQLPQ